MKSNFVLWQDGLGFYVSKRVGPKWDSLSRDHFVGFFETEALAYLEAERRVQDTINSLKRDIKRYRNSGAK